MICIIALVVFGILAIFSASYRPLAAEAFDCVFRKITLRPCRTSLDQRLKSKIVGKIMGYPRAARLVYKHFELMSWIFVVLMFASLAYAIYGGYNYALYGNCYGPEDTGGFCIYNALEGEHFTEIQRRIEGELVFPDADDDPFLGDENASVTIIEFGCYECPYTREAQPLVKSLLEKYGNRIKFVFRDFPVSQAHPAASIHSEAANCALEQGKFWEMHSKLFTEHETCQPEDSSTEFLAKTAGEIGLDVEKFNGCLKSHKYESEVEEDFEDGLKAGVYGTPTFFINNHTIIGPKPLRAFEKIIDEELAK